MPVDLTAGHRPLAGGIRLRGVEDRTSQLDPVLHRRRNSLAVQVLTLGQLRDLLLAGIGPGPT